MLNEQICKKCEKLAWGEEGFFMWHCSYDMMSVDSTVLLDSKSDPPEWCPYVLEHLMKSDKNRGKNRAK